MTERLSTLLRDEARDLTVPAPDPTAILRKGRVVRRRRRAGSALATVAAAATVVAGFTAVAPHAEQDRGDAPPAAGRATGDDGAFGAGSTVWPRGAAHAPVQVDGRVKAVYYTSVGVVARVGDTPYSDDPGPSRYVAINGAEPPRDLGVDLGDRVPATDATQPYLAYADKSATGNDRWDVVLADVRDGSEAARVTVGGTFARGGWAAPPVGLSGDHVYVSLDRVMLDVNWRTGAVDRSDVLEGSTIPVVAGGLTTVRNDRGAFAVVDTQTGETLMRVPGDDFPYLTLSPDGRYAKLVLQDSPESESSFTVHDLETGAERTIDGAPWDYGWTADGGLLKVTEDEATVCNPFDQADCASAPVDLGRSAGDLRVAGLSYES